MRRNIHSSARIATRTLATIVVVAGFCRELRAAHEAPPSRGRAKVEAVLAAAPKSMLTLEPLITTPDARGELWLYRSDCGSPSRNGCSSHKPHLIAPTPPHLAIGLFQPLRKRQCVAHRSGHSTAESRAESSHTFDITACSHGHGHVVVGSPGNQLGMPNSCHQIRSRPAGKPIADERHYRYTHPQRFAACCATAPREHVQQNVDLVVD